MPNTDSMSPRKRLGIEHVLYNDSYNNDNNHGNGYQMR